MKKLDFLIVHCTATPEGRDMTAEEIISYHTRPVAKGGRGWSRVGYSEMVNLKGDLICLRPYNEDDLVQPHEITNGAIGYNDRARHIVYVGGCDKKMNPKDTRTPAQRETLARYIRDFKRIHPETKVIGHNQVAAKACPSFDVPKFLREIGL